MRKLFQVIMVVAIFMSAGCTTSGGRTRLPTWQPSDTVDVQATTWVKKFEGPDYGAFFDVILTPDGNLLTVGATNHLHTAPYSGDALMMSLNPAGEVLWEQTWGGDGYEQAWSIAPDAEGGYYVFGETDSYGAGDRDFFLLRMTDSGEEVWYQTYGRSQREWPYGMFPLSDGDLLLYGLSVPETGVGRNQYAVRVNPEGDVMWEYLGHGSEEEIVIDALEMENGELVLTVIIGEDGGLLKLDPDGNVLWSKRYDLAGWQYASESARTSDGGFLLAGFSMNTSPVQQVDTWFARCTPEGELVWQNSFGFPAYDDYATAMIRLEDGTYLIGAIADGILLNRVDENGNILGRRTVVSGGVYGVMALMELENGGFIVAGLIQLINGRSYDAIILRTDENGLIQD